jgi:3-hydroxy-9,10-secoandrosta-1,3,5(10)-triene-9,17-dione monooxygenase
MARTGTTEATASERLTIAPPEPGLTPEEMIERATRMIPTLRARQAETEELTHLPQSTFEELIEGGFYRILQPRRYGGYEFDVPTFFKVMIELARGCPSTSWCYGFAHAHTMHAAALYSEEAQEDLYGPDGDFRAPFFAGLAVQATRVDGGYHLKGAWPYSSGAPYATHMFGQFIAPDDEVEKTGQLARIFVAPREIWTLRDDWRGQLGMRGSGSHTIDVDGFVPDRFVAMQFLPNLQVDGGTPGSRLHGNPMYAIRLMGFMAGELSSVEVGLAYAALDEYEEIIKSRTIMFMPAGMQEAAGSGTNYGDFAKHLPRRVEMEEYRRNYGIALGKIATAEAAVIRVGQRLIENGRKNLEQGAYPPDWDLELVAIQINAGELAMRAFEDQLFRTMGSSGAREGQRMNRYYRDSGMYWSHLLNMMTDSLNTNLGTIRLGVPGDSNATTKGEP